jgi:hypothetical protein
MDISESISVIASFGLPYKIKPLKFRWSGRLFEVREVTYIWQAKEGEKVIYHFSVSDGRSLYELTFDTRSLLWRIEKVEV